MTVSELISSHFTFHLPPSIDIQSLVLDHGAVYTWYKLLADKGSFVKVANSQVCHGFH